MLKNPGEGKVPFQDEVPAIFNLIYRVLPLQVDRLAVLFRELRPRQPGPVVQALFEDGGAELVGTLLECFRV
jgi:hypothetical protein